MWWACVTTAGLAAGAPPAEAGPAAAARAVFAAKCAGCHGPDLAKPAGRFGYVLDLGRVAGNPELVVPGRPAESELWVLVERGDMPPPDSPAGPLTPAEQEAVRAWVAAGAPELREPEPAAALVPDLSTADRAVRWLGKFHLLLLHFPIALVLAAVVGEAAAAWRGDRQPSPVARFCVALAAATAGPAVVLGWVHAAAGGGVGSPDLLAAHRWLGTAAGVWIVVTAAWGGRGSRVRWRCGLVVAAVLVAAAAHFGGSLAHGSDFLIW